MNEFSDLYFLSYLNFGCLSNIYTSSPQDILYRVYNLPQSTGVDCSTPKQLRHGTVNYDGTGYNMVVEYKCDEGYPLIGSSTRVCQSSGKWSGEEPVCEGNMQ